MINIFSLPLGIKEYTTKDVRKIDFISSVVLEESELWGYKKIITPIFEKINYGEDLTPGERLKGSNNKNVPVLNKLREENAAKLNNLVDLTPRGIRDHLKLHKPIYKNSAAYGHFGREAGKDGSFSWEKTDLVDQLKNI